jgi:hypothetical protein
MIQIWSLPAFAVALLVATIVQFRGSVVWWNVLLVAALVSVVEAIRMGDLYEAPFVLAVSLVLFVGAQLSRIITRWVGKLPI